MIQSRHERVRTVYRARVAGMLLAMAIALWGVTAVLAQPPGHFTNTGVYGSSGSLASAELASTSWPMFQHDVQHTGRSPSLGPQVPRLQWASDLGFIESSPAIGSDGTIYVGSTDGRLYAVTPTGTQKWAFATGGLISSSPAIGSDGTLYLYVSNRGSRLFAVTPTGTLQWVFATSSVSSPTAPAAPAIGIDSSPAIGSDGTIYVGTRDGTLYAVTPTGTFKWAFATDCACFSISAPAIGSDGTIYVAAGDGKLYAVTPTGTQKWAFATGNGWQFSTPAIGGDGTIYVGSTDGKLYAVTPTGTQKWAFATGDTIESSPIIGSDGTLYIGSHDQQLYAVTPTGTLKWAFALGSMVILSSPAMGSDGTLYIGTDKLYAIGAEPTSPLGRAVCMWGLYLDDHQTGGDWESRLFLANIDTQQAHTYEVFMLATDTVRLKRLSLEPSGIAQLTCGDMQACGAAGWLYVQSDAPVFAATLFVTNTRFGGGAFTAQTPYCQFGLS